MKKAIAVLSALIMMTAVIPANVSAENKWEDTALWATMNGGNPVRQGGVNKLDNVACENREDSEDLEQYIRDSGYYLLLNTDEKEVSDEDLATYLGGIYTPPYARYLNSANTHIYNTYKVYVYKPSFEDALEQIRERGDVYLTTKSELLTSTVVINYEQWYYVERAGKVVNEFNDNIPDWKTDRGFMQIESPIDVKVVIENAYDRTYNEVYVRGEEPLLLEVPHSTYSVTSINAVNMPSLEVTLGKYENNTFNIDVEHTKKNPHIVSLTAAIEKYGIEPADISEEPDYDYDSGEDVEYSEPYDLVPEEDIPDKEMTEHRVIVEERTEVDESGSHLFWTLLIIGIIVGAVLIILLICWLIRKRNSRTE